MEQRPYPGEPSETESSASAPSIEVECYARASTAAAPVDDAIRALQRLEQGGAIDALDFHVWPDTVALDGHASSSEAVEVFERFRAWARQWNVSICPPFEVRTRDSEITGETTETLVLPVCFVAVYAEGALVGVYPHSTDDRTYRTADAITTLARGKITAPGSDTRPSPTPEPGTCPGCSDPLVNGQALYHCTGCGWVGTVTESGQYRHSPRTTASSATLLDGFAGG